MENKQLKAQQKDDIAAEKRMKRPPPKLPTANEQHAFYTKWSSKPPTGQNYHDEQGNVYYKPIKFTGPPEGPTGTPLTPMEVFQSMITEEMIALLVLETNR